MGKLSNSIFYLCVCEFMRMLMIMCLCVQVLMCYPVRERLKQYMYATVHAFT